MPVALRGSRRAGSTALACLIAAGFGTAATVVADHVLAQSVPAPRPKIGLVLGGGGARGGAHLGILEVLESLRIPVDCVAGTSMGALVAGAYVAGKTPAEMKDAIAKTDWIAMFDDSGGREAVSMRRKLIDDRFYSGLEFGVTKDGLRYREGAVAGEKIKLFFNDLVRADLGTRNIESLPLPLTLIATDIGTGERVAMRTGNLTTAMRASMSVPGALAPVVRDGRKLVDGGLVDNVPIQEVRDRCRADVVIAVNVGSPLLKPDEVTSVVGVLGQMVNLLAEQNVAKSLSGLTPRDIYIRPELGDITAADFQRQLEAAAIGEKAARAESARLSTLSVPEAEYRAWQAKLRGAAATATVARIDEVRITDTRFVNREELRASVEQKDGEPLEPSELARDLVQIYSRGDFQSVDYEVLPEREKTILRITPIEKAWGPDYLRFGLNLTSDLRSESSYNIRALYRKSWLNSYGGEWLAALQLGSDQAIATEFYQPLDLRQRFFVRPYGAITRSKLGLWLDGRRVADYLIRDDRLGLEIGSNFGNWGLAGVGYVARQLRATVDTGASFLPNGSERVGGLTARFAADTRDYEFFPTRGMFAEVNYFQSAQTQGDIENYSRLAGRVGGAWTVGDFILLGMAEGGTTPKGQVPLSDNFALGGPLRLSAFAPGQIIGLDGYWVGSAQAQYRLTKALPLLGFSVLGGVSFEAGRMRNPLTEPTLTGTLTSYSAYLASNTVFGPIYLGWAGTPHRQGRYFLFIGTP